VNRHQLCTFLGRQFAVGRARLRTRIRHERTGSGRHLSGRWARVIVLPPSGNRVMGVP
jgi:hypothetical protein